MLFIPNIRILSGIRQRYHCLNLFKYIQHWDIFQMKVLILIKSLFEGIFQLLEW